MDWLSLVLLFFFFVLPIIQQIAEAAKKGKSQEGELPHDLQDLRIETEAERRRLEGGGGPAGSADEAEESWSSDWLPWPTETSEPEPVREERIERPAPVAVKEAERRDRESAIDALERLRYRGDPRPARVAEPVAPVAPARLATPYALRQHGPNRAVRRLDLHNPEALRRGIIVSEVLGSPVALRPPFAPAPPSG